MVPNWTPIFVLPNIPLLTAIECDIAAIVPANDPRVTAVKRAHPVFRRFLNRFSDNFGEKFEPAMLILRADAPAGFLCVSALASFRDLAAISTIAYNHALKPQQQHSGHRVMFGEAFTIYPWMLDQQYRDVIGRTPAILGIREVAKFKGQSSPTVFRTSLDTGDIDQPLLAVLMQRWRQRYNSVEPVWEDIALFRSLNMAYHASLLPAATDSTFYDVGRIVSLWVSAFEILVHPGGSGQANRDKVFELIERTNWAIPASGACTHDTGGKIKVKRTLASWLYQALCNCRNDFLHGNPVEQADLILTIPQRPVLEYAAPLYRVALTAFLPLNYDKPPPPFSPIEPYAEYRAKRTSFLDPQKRIESAILMATMPPTPSTGPASTGPAKS